MKKRKMCNTYHRAPVRELLPSGTDVFGSGRLRPETLMLIKRHSFALMSTYFKGLERRCMIMLDLIY